MGCKSRLSRQLPFSYQCVHFFTSDKNCGWAEIKYIILVWTNVIGILLHNVFSCDAEEQLFSKIKLLYGTASIEYIDQFIQLFNNYKTIVQTVISSLTQYMHNSSKLYNDLINMIQSRMMVECISVCSYDNLFTVVLLSTCRRDCSVVYSISSFRRAVCQKGSS